MPVHHRILRAAPQREFALINNNIKAYVCIVCFLQPYAP